MSLTPEQAAFKREVYQNWRDKLGIKPEEIAETTGVSAQRLRAFVDGGLNDLTDAERVALAPLEDEFVFAEIATNKTTEHVQARVHRGQRERSFRNTWSAPVVNENAAVLIKAALSRVARSGVQSLPVEYWFLGANGALFGACMAGEAETTLGPRPDTIAAPIEVYAVNGEVTTFPLDERNHA